MQPAPLPLDQSLYQPSPTRVDLAPVPASAPGFQSGVQLPTVPGVTPSNSASENGQDLDKIGADSDTATAPTPANKGGLIASGLSGIAAGFQQKPSDGNTGTAVMDTLASGVEGAAGGAEIGSVIPGVGTGVGAAVGGTVGLVVGGVNSYLSLSSAREQQRAAEKQAEQIAYWNQRAIKQNREDYNDQTAYNRRTQANISQWAAYKDMGDKINAMVASDPKLQALYKGIMR